MTMGGLGFSRRVLASRNTIRVALALSLMILAFQSKGLVDRIIELREAGASQDEPSSLGAMRSGSVDSGNVGEVQHMVGDPGAVAGSAKTSGNATDHGPPRGEQLVERDQGGHFTDDMVNEQPHDHGKDDAKDTGGVAIKSMPPSASPSSSPPFVIILGQWRFGSSIVGELFNQNPEIFYMFEPLYLVDILRKLRRLPFSPFSQGVHDYSTQVLRGIARCNFTKEFIRYTGKWTGFHRSNAICPERQSAACTIRSADWLSGICAKFKGHTVLKVIRADLENIKPMIVEDKVNVKIIHLVRDPRGAAASRIHYYFEQWPDIVDAHQSEIPKKGRLAAFGLNSTSVRLKDCIPSMCMWMRNNTHTPQDLPAWLRGRYHLLRYEDFAESPIEVTEELYNVLGLPLPVEVRKYVVNNTLTDKSTAGTFEMHKNSRATARRWISDLSELEIKQVEAECSDVMKKLGYQPYAKLKSPL